MHKNPPLTVKHIDHLPTCFFLGQTTLHVLSQPLNDKKRRRQKTIILSQIYLRENMKMEKNIIKP